MRASRLVVLSSALLVSGCVNETTGPRTDLVRAAATPIAATAPSTIHLDYVDLATGVDDGPQDGIFDSFTIPNLGSVNNNGFTSFRTAFEFNLADIPAGASIGQAQLTLNIGVFEGPRQIQLHIYPGDGTVQLSDFAATRVAGVTSVHPIGSQTLVFDVTSVMIGLLARGGTFAGFTVREEPPNAPNYTVMFMPLFNLPRLSIQLASGG